MTEKQMLKYEGKCVKVVKNIFHYSVQFETLTGVVRSVRSKIITPRRNGENITKEHISFYVGERLIKWNELKLIKTLEVVDE